MTHVIGNRLPIRRTVSISPSDTGGQTRSRLPTLQKILWLTLVMGTPAWCEETALKIVRAELTRQDARHLLDADIEYRLSDTADEALRNGVPLAFELRLTVHDEPRRWWNRPVVDERRVFRVHYHSLAKLFQWTPDGG